MVVCCDGNMLQRPNVVVCNVVRHKVVQRIVGELFATNMAIPSSPFVIPAYVSLNFHSDLIF